MSFIGFRDVDLSVNNPQVTALAPAGEPLEAGTRAVTREAQRVVDIATLGGLFLAAALGLVLAFDHPSVVFLAYVFLLGLAPPAAAILVYWNEQGDASGAHTIASLRIAVKSLLLCLLIAVAVFVVLATLLGPAVAPDVIGVVSLGLAAVVVFLLLQSLDDQSFAGGLDACLIVALTVVVFAFSPFNPAQQMPIGLLDYALGVPHFGYWILLGAAWTATGIWLRRHEGWAFPHRKKLLETFAVTAAGIVVLLLYDDSHFTDFSHYMPLVGPAMHATRGGIPMVDVYSVYGFLPWLIDRAAFALFTPSFGTAAVVVRLINLCYFGTMLAILVLVTRRRLSALWFFVPALFVSITSHADGPGGMWNMNALPMTLGGRNLLPALMALVMIVSLGRNWGRWLSLTLIMLASVSSVEILAFTLAPWGYCLLLDAVRARSLRLIAVWIGLAALAVAVAQGAMVAVLYLSTGAVADYRPYLSLFFQFRPTEDSIWSVPFVPYYALWLPGGFAYFVIMVAAGLRALRGEAATSLVDRLLPVAAFGLGPLAYFMGRPQEGTLNVSCLSFAVVALAIAEPILVNGVRFSPAAVALSRVMAVSFAFIAADGFEHFLRPTDPGRGNSTVLRRCLSSDGCHLGEVLPNIALALRTPPLDRRTGVAFGVHDDGHRQRIEEVTSMLQRLAPQAHQVGMLADLFPHIFADSDPAIGIAAFMTTGQWYAWSVSSPINDGVSPLVTEQVLRRVDSTADDLLVITPNRSDDWAPMNQAIWQRLRQRCHLKPVEKGQYHTAFLTEDCHG